MVTSPAWVVVETKPLCEEMVERTLRQAGYRVYLPRFRKLLTPHGRERRPVTSMRPLFTQLIFAQDWQGWPAQPISGTVGLMVLRPGVPAKLSDLDVFVIMERERAGEFDDVKHPQGSGGIRPDIEVGETVELERFGARVMGVLEQLTDDGKAIIQAMLFGRAVRTTVPAEEIRRASG